ncbi:MAG: acetolactate synthase [Myxococcales bacterium]|nr:acetolactate synthase [Myxococcales bacterium]
MPVHGGKLAARALKQAGVECIFTLSGGHVMAIYDGCIDEGIRVIDVRHEQAAVHAADAWSRLNPGKIGVAVLTAGPGVTDGVTGVANAWRANSPILVIGGQGPFSNMRRGSLQEMDHVSVMRPITKWADACYETARIPDYIEVAIRYAVSGNPGPSFLEIPMDVLGTPVDEDKVRFPVIRTSAPKLAPPREEVLGALELIRDARRPVLMAGTSVKWSNARAALNAFIDELHLPSFVNGMGRGQIPYDSPQLFNRVRREALKQCDVFVLAGSVLDFRLGYGRSVPAEAKIVQLDLENTLIGHNRSSDVALVGSLDRSFELLLQVMKEESIQLDFAGWTDELRVRETELETAFRSQLDSDEVPIDPLRMCREIRDVVDENTIVIGDGGDIVAQASKVVPVMAEGAWMDPGPLGTLGVGMPFALAAQLAHPNKRVLIVYGDGAFGLNGMEFDTAIRFGLPIVGVVGNDAAWGQMLRPQVALYGEDRVVATQLNYTRYDLVVEALGGHGEYCERPEEIRPALERAFESGKPALVNVKIRKDVTTGMKGSTYV